jgi:hypothetical protein
MLSGLASSVAWSTDDETGDGEGVGGGGGGTNATPLNCPGTHSPAGPKLPLLYGKSVTLKLRRPADFVQSQTREPSLFPQLFPSHSPCASEYTPPGSKSVASPATPE